MSAFREGGRFPDASTVGIAATLVALPFVLPSVTLASEVLVFSVAALSCAFLLGMVGLLSFGQGLFFGIGAYVSAVLLKDHGLATLPAVAIAAGASAIGAGLIALLAVRRHGVYFVMLTLAFAQMGYFAMLALNHVTGGENGLTGVPRPPLLAGMGALSGSEAIYAFLAVLAFAAYLLVQRVGASPFGSVLRAIRQNEPRAEALGYDVRRFKVAAFALAGLLAGLAGAMHTVFLGFAPPNVIELEMSERLLIMAIIGGAGAPGAAFVGAGFYVVMADWLSTLWPRWLMLIGFLLIAIVLFLRDGLWGGAAAALHRLRGRGHG
ncbi:branched-chain amino acid ABC transporter permease [Neoroseomonas soli]|uniref:Branched-chain amino acid ABC transporter permease n=1 Tax=Neoroseomonas soli TaxID=1081025 RepID=A0A9X9WTH4_9PROT|nr:branched-chain amino acid ABC transporter permease [Neoroseomonas soli]MBR0670453.1 branched-chain amino acid ABC transporter permease [Neoroseomonas soli]